MKKIVSLIMLCFSIALIAQNEISKTVGEFTTLKVYDLINVKMIKSDINKVDILGKNKNAVQIINKNGKLKIRMKIKEIYDGSRTDITLYYTNVDVIDANEGAKVTLQDTIKQFEIEFRVQEGSEITANADVSLAFVRAVTGGVINLEGKSVKQEVSIYTGGVFNGSRFVTEDTMVRINAAGEADIHATKKVKIRIKAGGDVNIYGKPKIIDKKRVFGGRVKEM